MKLNYYSILNNSSQIKNEKTKDSYSNKENTDLINSTTVEKELNVLDVKAQRLITNFRAYLDLFAEKKDSTIRIEKN
jgi:hypothetical protein